MEVHPHKNGDLVLEELHCRSKAVITWQCAKNPDHIWEQRVVDRTRMKDPSCRKCRSLGAMYPDLSRQWHPTKNNGLEPLDVLPSARRLAWWVCENKHEFQAFISNRVKYPDKCDQCRSLLFRMPEVAAEWHLKKNGDLSPADIFAGSEKKVWWQCAKNPDHEWQSVVYSRLDGGGGCPFCPKVRNVFEDSLEALFPELVPQWHIIKNGDLKPSHVTPGSNKKVWWQCSENHDHVWETQVINRTKIGTSCPYCKNRKITPENSLKFLRPDLAEEWHPTKNGELTPSEVFPGGKKSVWWKCKRDSAHEWEAPLHSRSGGSGCPFCNMGWTVDSIRIFVKSLLPHLDSFTPAELYVLLQQNGLTASLGKSKSFIQALKTGRFPAEELEKFVGQRESLVDEFIEGEINSLEEGVNVDAVAESESDVDETSFEKADDSARQAALPEVNVNEVLSSLDSQVVSSADEEAIEFLVASALAKLWKRAYVALDDAVDQAKAHRGGEYAGKVRDAFLSEVERAQTLPVPKGYNFRVNNKLTEPNLMQRHLAARLMSHKRVGNWSGTGAGKTLSAIYSSRLIDAKLTVICCPNSVVSGWVNNIKSIFPDSEVQEKTWQPSWSEDGKARYLVLNFEAFQQTDSENNVSQFCSRNQVNLLVVDEIHYAKQRHSENMSKRRQLITAFSSLSSQGTENYYVLGMSATPVINNLHEGKSLIDLVTGIDHSDLNVKPPTVFNCMRMHQKLVTLGIRWMPKYEANLEVVREHIDCEDYLEDIRSLGNSGTPLELEKILTKARLPVIVKHVRRKTLIYTHYISEIDRILRDALVAEGWSVGFYTGEEKSGLDSFINGDLDVLIGSSAIGTGVDGLQTVCDQLIINVLPWTAAQYEQLIGRIHRQGQTKERVSVVIPITESKVNDAVWSWCASKLKRLEYKKSIADAVVDGVVPEGHLRTEAQAYKDVMSWLERLDKGDLATVARSPVDVNLDNFLVSEDDSKEAKKRRLSEFSRMNANWNNSLSKTTANKLSKDDSEWKIYHQLYREAREDWPVIPFEEFIRWAQDRVDLEIGDFGCGEALVAKELEGSHIIHSFDHVAVNESVIAGDMSRVPLDDCTLDVALFSLSLMGKNFTDYLCEAHRTLRLDGHLHIWEATSRFKDIDLFEKQLQSLGFNKYQRNIGDKFTHLHLIKSGKRIDESVVVSF